MSDSHAAKGSNIIDRLRHRFLTRSVIVPLLAFFAVALVLLSLGDVLLTVPHQSAEPLMDSYDTGRDISRVVTALSPLVGFMIAGCRWYWKFARRKTSKIPVLRLSIETILLIFVLPTAVHLLGTFAISNTGSVDIL
jgi:hypothetical protein